MTKYKLLKNRIKKNEGYKSFAYFDQLGFSTIGYGHLIKPNEKIFFKQKFSKKFLLNIFNLEFNETVMQYEKNYHKYNFSNNIRDVLIEMIFQLGINGQKKFLKMNEHMKKKTSFYGIFRNDKQPLVYSNSKKSRLFNKYFVRTA